MELIDLPTPARSGTLWTDDDYELALDEVKAGAGVDRVAEALQRKPEAVANKLRRLLPVQQRKCPPDRTVPALRAAIADPHYDWRQVVLEVPPDPPVTQIVRKGLPGLDATDLARIVYTLATIRMGGADELLHRGLEEVSARGLDYLLMQARATALIQQDSPLTMHEAMECARDWLESLHDGRSVYFDEDSRPRRIHW